jgi:hypothetical protein
MIAALPSDRMPPPHPSGIARFERFFRVAARLDVDKQDFKRYREFVNRKVYDLLIRAEATAKANGRNIIAPFDLRITKGLQECIHAFRQKRSSSSRFWITSRRGRRSTLLIAKRPRRDCRRSWAA